MNEGGEEGRKKKKKRGKERIEIAVLELQMIGHGILRP